MEFSMRYFGRCLLAVALAASWAMPTPANAVAKGEEMACKLQSTIVPRSAEFARSDLISIRFLISNVGDSACTLPADLGPEGWVIRLFVKEPGGAVAYQSSIVKIEMTRAKIADLVTVLPNNIYGVNFSIKQFPPGEYAVDGVFSTIHLSNWKIPRLPIGSWEAPVVRFKVLP